MSLQLILNRLLVDINYLSCLCLYTTFDSHTLHTQIKKGIKKSGEFLFLFCFITTWNNIERDWKVLRD